MAQEVLTHLKEHPDAWTRVDTILEFSQNMNTKVSKLTFIDLVFFFLPFINFEEGISFLAIDFLDSNHLFFIVLFPKLALNKNCKWTKYLNLLLHWQEVFSFIKKKKGRAKLEIQFVFFFQGTYKHNASSKDWFVSVYI